MNKKKLYEKPQSAVTRVELESPICSGSVDMTAESPHGVGTTAQEINKEFDNANDFTTGADTSWDK